MAQSISYRIDPFSLEEPELAYENAIRPETGDTPGSGATSIAGRVSQRMNVERENDIDPVSIGILGGESADDLRDELALCEVRITELTEQLLTQFMVMASGVPLQNPPRIKSRLLHYEYRLRRIPRESLSNGQQLRFDNALRLFTQRHAMLEPLIQPNEEGYAVLRPLQLNNTVPSHGVGGMANSTMNNQGDSARLDIPRPHSPLRNVHAHAQTRTQATSTPDDRPQNEMPATSNRYQRSFSYTEGVNHMASEARRAMGGVAFDTQQPSVFRYTGAGDRTGHTNQYAPPGANMFGIPRSSTFTVPNGTTPLPRAPAMAQSQNAYGPANPNANRPPIPPRTGIFSQNHPQNQRQTASGMNSFTTGNHAYHPATTPFPYGVNEDPLQLNEHPEVNSWTQSVNMNPCQAQQFLGRILANRKYEGDQTDAKLFVSLEEFISLVRQYKISTGYGDRTILGQISTFMTGAAFTWWQTNGHRLVTLDEMEARLRTRFERQATDPMSVMLSFVSRKQGRDEDLLDYIDEMRQKLLRCPEVPEALAIEKIVDNTNETYNRILSSRPYASITHLVQHAEYLMRGKPKRTAQPAKSDKKPPYVRPKIFTVESVDECETESTKEMDDNGNQVEWDDNEQAEFVAAVTKFMNRGRKPIQKTPNKRFESGTRAKPFSTEIGTDAVNRDSGPRVCGNCLRFGHVYAMCPEEKKIRCYGCGAPDEFKSNCLNCNGPNPKNPYA